jgi:hypothetical protein
MKLTLRSTIASLAGFFEGYVHFKLDKRILGIERQSHNKEKLEY